MAWIRWQRHVMIWYLVSLIDYLLYFAFLLQSPFSYGISDTSCYENFPAISVSHFIYMEWIYQLVAIMLKYGCKFRDHFCHFRSNASVQNIRNFFYSEYSKIFAQPGDSPSLVNTLSLSADISTFNALCVVHWGAFSNSFINTAYTLDEGIKYQLVFQTMWLNFKILC